MSEKREYPEWMGKMRALTKEEIKEFLDGPVVARLGTVKPDGSPYVVPVWQEYDGEAVYFIPREKSAFISDLTLEIARRMAVRYLGERGPEYLEPSQSRPRYLIKLVPDKVTSWEGVEWHSKYLEENT
jgi:hypothetical protein